MGDVLLQIKHHRVVKGGLIINSTARSTGIRLYSARLKWPKTCHLVRTNERESKMCGRTAILGRHVETSFIATTKASQTLPKICNVISSLVRHFYCLLYNTPYYTTLLIMKFYVRIIHMFTVWRRGLFFFYFFFYTKIRHIHCYGVCWLEQAIQ